MLKALIKTRLMALMGYFARSNRSAAKRSVGKKLIFILLGVYLIAVFFFMFGAMFFTLCKPLHEAGIGFLYFALAGILALLFSFIGSVFTAQVQLFEAKDNELLLAMPIPAGYILASRMIMLYVLAQLYGSLVYLPAAAIYIYSYGVTAAQILAFIVIWLLLPFVSLVFTCLIGWLVAEISSRMRRKNLITTIVSLAFMGAYFAVYSKIQDYMNLLIANGAKIAEGVRAAMPPFYRMGLAAGGDILSLLLFALWAALPFAAVYCIITRNFLHIATTKRGTARVEYRERALAVSAPRRALAKKEIRHFACNAMYMLNAAFGVVFMVALPVVLIFKREAVFEMFSMLPAVGEHIGAAVAGGYCILCSTVSISAASVSLEGNNIWIAKSAPISYADALLAKADAHMAISMPAAAAGSLATALLLGVDAPKTAAVVLIACAMSFFTAELGVAVNMTFPRLDYISEVAAVKSGASTIVSMLAGTTTVGLLVLLYILCGRLGIHILIPELVLLLCAGWWLRHRNATKGAAKFAEL